MSSPATAARAGDPAAAEIQVMPVPTGAVPELQTLRVEVQRLRLALKLSRAREERMRLLASQDTLTGLPNRREFEFQSFRAVARHRSDGHEFGLLFIDLDGFKTINDQFGHDIGDELLMVIGSRLAHAVRVGDSISRHGGDEFVCLLPDVRSEDQAASIANKLHDAISAPCQVGPLLVSVSPSIGMALYPRDATTVAGLLRNADHAMRWAKQERLGQAFFSRMPKSLRVASAVVRSATNGRTHCLPAANPIGTSPPA